MASVGVIDYDFLLRLPNIPCYMYCCGRYQGLSSLPIDAGPIHRCQECTVAGFWHALKPLWKL